MTTINPALRMLDTLERIKVEPAHVIRTREVSALTGLSRTTLWRLRQRGGFPMPRRVSDGVCGWLSADVDQWIKSRPVAAR